MQGKYVFAIVCHVGTSSPAFAPPPPSKTNLLQARPDLRFGHVLNAVISFFPYTSKVTKSQYIEVYAGICESRLLKGWFTWCS